MADLDKIRTAVKLWAPRATAAALGAVAGVSLGVFAVRAVVGFAADKGGAVMAVAAVLAIAATNAAVWRMWGQHKTAAVRAARNQRQVWQNHAGEWELLAGELAAEAKRLKDENEQLRRAEVAHLPRKQAGGES